MLGLKRFDLYAACLSIIVVVALFAALVFWRLGDLPLQDYDEAIYAQVSRQALQDGAQFEFKWFGNRGLNRSEQWFEKPPLMLWLTEGAYIVFGVNEFAARFWPALFAVFTGILAFFFVKKLSAGSIAAGFFSLAGFFICSQFMSYARTLQFDIPTGFFILAALYCFWPVKENSLWWFGFWSAIGLGVLSKSVVGLLPFLPLLLFSAITRDFKFLSDKNFYRGAGIFLLLVLPWHVIETIKFGRAFWDQYFFYHLLKRYSSGLEGNGQGVLFYYRLIKQQTLLFYCLIAAGLYALTQITKSRAYVFLLTILFCIFVFFTSSKTKLPAYILVIYPYICGLIALAAYDFFGFLLKNHIKLKFALVYLTALVFIFIGSTNSLKNPDRADKARKQYLQNSKQVGQFLQNYDLGKKVYYYSSIGTKPASIFYSNRVIYYLPYPSPKPEKEFLLISEVKPDYQNLKPLLVTPTQAVYQVK